MVRLVETLPIAELDAVGSQRRNERVEQQGLLSAHHTFEGSPDIGQKLLRGAAVEGSAGDAGNNLTAQSSHLDLEELVDPLGKEDEELHPLEQRQVGLGNQVE